MGETLLAGEPICHSGDVGHGGTQRIGTTRLDVVRSLAERCHGGLTGDRMGAVGVVLDELERIDGQFGLITMCAGGGMAPAIIIERV